MVNSQEFTLANNQEKEENKVKKTFEIPEISVETFFVEDVVTTGAGGDNELSFRD